ncbi:MAG: hypothetical protein ACE15D_02855 [Candidatus Eisenbacteria bacterium]
MNKSLFIESLCLLGVISFCAAVAGPALAGATRATIPDGAVIVSPHDGQSRVPCDVEIRYDDGEDDSPDSGPVLGWSSETEYQYLGVIFTAPVGEDFLVQSASWYSDFWVFEGDVDVTAYEINDPANTATETLYIDAGGTYAVEFSTPICVPGGTDYVVMLCPGHWVEGVLGEDWDEPDYRSYFSRTTCDPLVNYGPSDFMLWSCVTPCGPTSVRSGSWGRIRTMFR